MAQARRGEIWMVDLDPTRGHEQAGRRPALIVSADAFNAGPSGLVIVVPVTTRSRRIRTHVAIQPPEGGLRKPSYAKCEDVRSIALERLSKRLGAASAATLAAVGLRLRFLMDL